MTSEIFPMKRGALQGLNLGRSKGLEPGDWKPMQTIGKGVQEIRIHVLGEWRVIYIAKFGDAVYILHAFQKKSGKTNRRDIELARQRYGQIGGRS